MQPVSIITNFDTMLENSLQPSLDFQYICKGGFIAILRCGSQYIEDAVCLLAEK